MKTLRTVILYAMLGISATSAYSQSTSKNNLFNSLPEKTPVSAETLAASMELKEGRELTIKLSDGFEFKGKVISNLQKYHNLQSVLIESVNIENTVFQISRQLNEDKSFTYVGKMLSTKSGDGLKITMDEQGKYYLTKFETHNILQDCSYTH